MGAQVAIGNCPRKRIDQRVAQDITVGVCVESDVGRHGHTAKHEFVSGEEPVDVVADARAKRDHAAQPRRSSIVRTAFRRPGSDARVASWTLEPGG
jgi:hypothetical protein